MSTRTAKASGSSVYLVVPFTKYVGDTNHQNSKWKAFIDFSTRLPIKVRIGFAKPSALILCALDEKCGVEDR